MASEKGISRIALGKEVETFTLNLDLDISVNRDFFKASIFWFLWQSSSFSPPTLIFLQAFLPNEVFASVFSR
jgi:hypothetical protein